MWLLSTNCAELRFFAGPEVIDGGYAILSHTWGKHEQSFQDIQELHKRCSMSGENPRDLICLKIQGCCLLAEKHGYKWVWIDSCCIDKTSSSELSEAINSMFYWYTCAEVCYAFLEDVPSDCVLHAKDSAFRRARWHTRGWTLQELIAPALLIFVAQDWTLIGQKNDLAPLLQQITSIRSEILTREVSFHRVCITERMTWASIRNTTRIEDEAYCLMGLFGVTMPTLYGEGRQAFQRLQQEIMKTSFDTSLFAWDDERLAEFPLADGTTEYNPPSLSQVQIDASYTQHGYPLAYSPHLFCRPAGEPAITFTPTCPHPLQQYPPASLDLVQQKEETHEGPFGPLELPRFALTNHGIQCRFPVIEVHAELVIAVLLCETRDVHVGLLLHPADASEYVQDLTRPTYLCGYLLPSGLLHRLVNLGPDLYNLRYRGQRVQAAWRDFFLLTTLPPWQRDEALNVQAPFNTISPAPPFRIPQWLLMRLKSANLRHAPLLQFKLPSAGDPTFHVVVRFHDVLTGEGLSIVLGTCVQSGHPTDRPHHWAQAHIRHRGTTVEQYFDALSQPHSCSQDHLENWEAFTKEFGNEARKATLSFSRCKLTPASTFVLHLELEGSVYSAWKEASGIALPPPSPA